MLLGTHPIPARSPAEREGQNGMEMGGQMRRGRGGGTGSLWVENGADGMIGGGDREKVGILGEGELRMVIHEEGKREKMEGLLSSE